jgi:hypothetical protein
MKKMKPRILESTFQKRVLRDLKTIKGLYFHKHQAGSIRGIPDIIGSVSGIFFAFELKRDEKSVATELQQYTLDKIQNSGGIALVVYPEIWPNVYRILLTISEEKASVQNLLSRITEQSIPSGNHQDRDMHGVSELQSELQPESLDDPFGTALRRQSKRMG